MTASAFTNSRLSVSIDLFPLWLVRKEDVVDQERQTGIPRLLPIVRRQIG